MRITGQCHCRAISFTATVDPSKVLVCHCTDCQQFSGAPFRAVFEIPESQRRELRARLAHHLANPNERRYSPEEIRAYCLSRRA